MKRIFFLLFILLVFLSFVDAKTSTKTVAKKAPVCLTIQAENGSIRQEVNADGSIKCIIKKGDVIRVSSIMLNGDDVTNKLESNILTIPLITENSTLEITFDNVYSYMQPVYNTITMF